MAVPKINRRNNAGEVFLELGAATDQFEQYSHAHAARIATLADEMARRLGLAEQDRRSLHNAALLHDLGEAAMERDYISRDEKLTDDERIDLSRHPLIGEQEAGRAGADRAAQLLVRWHHEWWNGSGYPDALREEEIPLAARILRVADAYASLTDARPFRRAFSEEEARQELIQWAGIEFDPRVVALLLTLESMPELKSFAGTEEVAKVESRVAPGLFASFTK